MSVVEGAIRLGVIPMACKRPPVAIIARRMVTGSHSGELPGSRCTSQASGINRYRAGAIDLHTVDFARPCAELRRLPNLKECSPGETYGN